MRWLPVAALALFLLPVPARACDPFVRTVQFLGWTEDSRFFAYAVKEAMTCKKCKDPSKREHVFVHALTGDVEEYVTVWTSRFYPRPNAMTKADLDAWLARHPLRKTKASLSPPKNAGRRLAMTLAGKPVAPKGALFCPNQEAEVTLGIEGGQSRPFRGGRGPCGCARGFWSPDERFVAWLTGPDKRTCDDCHGSFCCAAPEALAVPAE